MSTQSRQPRGIPVGGQFATSAHTESGVSLDATTQDEHEAAIQAEMARRAQEKARWGSVNVQEGSRTPWGAAQTVNHPAAGIAVASCAGHGGVKLSPERNAAIPAPLRNKSGWYEEDCEAQIVGMYFPETFPHYRGADVADEDQADWRRAAFEQSVRSWFPDEYTKATGNEVSLEESSILRDRAKQADKDAFRAEHSSQFVTLGNGDTHAKWIPDGYAACEARLDDAGEKRTFLMPRGEVITDGMYGRHALVDPDRHLDVTDIVNARPEGTYPYHPEEVAPIAGEDLVIDYSGLTGPQASRARTELGKQWRFRNDDGTETVESLGEHMARVGVVGKRPYVDGDKVTYSVCYPGSRVTTVSKASYDALTSVPDTSTDTMKAYVARERARVRFERVKVESYDGRTHEAHVARRAKAQADYERAIAEHQSLSNAESERARAWQEQRTQMQQDLFVQVSASNGRSFD